MPLRKIILFTNKNENETHNDKEQVTKEKGEEHKQKLFQKSANIKILQKFLLD